MLAAIIPKRSKNAMISERYIFSSLNKGKNQEKITESLQEEMLCFSADLLPLLICPCEKFIQPLNEGLSGTTAIDDGGVVLVQGDTLCTTQIF